VPLALLLLCRAELTNQALMDRKGTFIPERNLRAIFEAAILSAICDT